MIITIGSSLLPLISMAILLKIYESKYPTLLELSGMGQIIIICIPISIVALYSLYDTKENKRSLNFSDLLFWVTLLLSVLAIFIYAYGVKEFSISQKPREGLVTFSIIYLTWTVVTTFFSRFFEVSSISVETSRQSDIKTLETKFRTSK